jgi:hypothetical protein
MVDNREKMRAPTLVDQRKLQQACHISVSQHHEANP